jgi:hypothetical protein
MAVFATVSADEGNALDNGAIIVEYESRIALGHPDCSAVGSLDLYQGHSSVTSLSGIATYNLILTLSLSSWFF